MDKKNFTLLSLTGWCSDIILTKANTFVGRASECDVRIGLGHISSKHAKVVVDVTGKVMVQDLSRNGTFINGTLVGRHRCADLQNGDTLSLTPPGELSVEAVAFVYRDGLACDAKLSVFQEISKGSHLEVLQKLGSGSFGDVYLGVSNGAKRAVKVVKKVQNGAQEHQIFEEVKVMDRLRHPNIVGIYNVWDTKEALVMTLDLASGGDLENLLRKVGRLSESDSKSLICQVLNALSYLHGELIIHRDLKPENILLKEPLHSKAVPHLLLTDFGLSRILQKHLPKAMTICGTPFYIAPEIVQANIAKSKKARSNGYDEKVDLWSTGILLYRFINGKLPWSGSASLETQILQAADPTTPVRVEYPISRACRHFLESLVVDPAHRLKASEALKHEWFEESRRLLANPISEHSETQSIVENDIVPDQFENRQLPQHSTPDSGTKRTRILNNSNQDS